MSGHTTRITAALIANFALAQAIAGATEPRPCSTDQITLQTLAWTEAQQTIAEHKGHVVLVDIWTTTCPTCLEHFPKFVELNQRLQGRGFVSISVNCDYDGIPAKPPSHYAPRVLKFLREHDAKLTNLLLTDPLVDFLETAKFEATPTYLLYDRSGKLLQQFDGATEDFTFDLVAQAVESAISERCETSASSLSN
jgi:thiol-disulfide isomerase/thioredoxin